MDSTIHHDPFAPEVTAMPGPAFRHDRWKRAGATAEQLLHLAEQHLGLEPAAQEAEGNRIDGVSDYDLADELAGRRRADEALNPAEGKVQDVLDQVGQDPGLAQAALDAENASEKPRTTLVSKLQAIVAAAQTEPAPAVEAPPAV